MPTDPALSVIVVTRDCVATVKRLIEHLQRQTVAAKLEVILVGPNADAVSDARELLVGFARSRLVVCDGEILRGRGTACGLRHATAPLVALTEDHSYPDETWAERVIAAYDERWAAVGSRVRNANPESAWSRVNHDLAYGRWTDGARDGEIDDVPGFNSVFSRPALLALGADLEPLLDRVAALHQAIRRGGGRFLFHSEAVLNHWNPSVRLPSVRLWFRIGRCFGHHRARTDAWSVGRRLIYLAAAPLIALMRLRNQRLARQARMAPPESFAYYAVLALLVTAVGFGESFGYVAGEGRAIVSLSDFEFCRDRYLRPRDRMAFLG